MSTPLAAAQSLTRLFDEAARRWPDAVACRDESTTLTYAGLAARADALAAHLAARGVRPGERVGLLLDRTVDVVAAILGVLRAGAVYVPLDPAYPAQRLAFMLADAGIGTLVGDPALAGGFALDGVQLVDPARVPPGTAPAAAPAEAAYVIYTSGSTGTPKGCLVSHGNVLELLRHTLPLFDVGPGDVWSLFHSYNFDFSVWEMWGALATGGTVVMVPRAVAQSPADFLVFLCKQEVTVLNQVPSVFRYLAEHYREAGTPPLPVRHVVFGGESVDLDVVADFVAAVPDTPPVMINMYGITEITVHATIKVLTAADLAGPARSPIGRPLPHLRIDLLDEDGIPVPDGQTGEIWVGGTGVALGYLNRPDLTAQRFTERDGLRWYRAGDLARRLPDGELDYQGRCDAQVKLRGYRIELAEVEAVLRAHPGVRDAGTGVVVNRHGVQQLVACYVPAGEVTLDELRDHARTRLPGYMVPDRFAAIGALPLTPSGKLDRSALDDLCAAAIVRRRS
ncbi:hypothetical protein Cs7R123_02300 [Catellatospora sp. TT07R-123]|uniref:amino acid adenylation domain-containing protein n=1 Tax=Catellatospora sp. TT07R-123 TaxID=2733863 RepID=UPI001B2822FD|nr:amino acid adenylation domain-containing protein [Catellatospora sp. TT07R-123]GHJ42888.1 hypothetical protein Cs7R123_02300 [Catellatospora sp. TT07R-123]